MICPDCQERMGCNQTKNFRDEYFGFYYVERRRICSSCGFTSMSIEVLQDVFNNRFGGENAEQEHDGNSSTES